jgi:hypothetical protein
MTENRIEGSLIDKYSEFLRGLRKSDRELFQKLLSDIESHYYMFSSPNNTIIEDLLLGFLLNQKHIAKLDEAVKNLKKSMTR